MSNTISVSLKKINTDLSGIENKGTTLPSPKKMKIIYEPSGRAREYSSLAVNLYDGCTHGCTYCYVPKIRKKTRENFHAAVQPVEDALKRLKADAKEMAANKDDREILFSFTCDPYPKIEAEQNITREAIKILKKNNLRFTILTKAGTRAEKDFDLLEGYDKASFGTTLIFTSREDADIWEPHAASIEDRIKTIKKAKELRIKTWVSIEPVIDPEQALQLIEQQHESVDHWKVGKINHNKELEDKVDWLHFRENVRILLKSKVPDKIEPQDYFYLKRSLTAKDKIEVILGKRSNILLVAPHGVYGDDDNTGEVVRAVAEKIGCYAVINEYFQKPELDKNNKEITDEANKRLNLNRLEQVESSDEAKTKYLAPIREITKEITNKGDKAIVVWIHGVDDTSIDRLYQDDDLQDLSRKPEILIGYGQGEEKETSKKLLVDYLSTNLENHKIFAQLAPVGSNYCAAKEHNLTRLFLQPDYKNLDVASIQLEIKYSGFRDYQNINKTAKALAHAIGALSEPLVEGIQEKNLSDIKCKTPEDRKYIYREANFKDKKLAKLHETKIKALADSIRNEGLLQPIGVMRQNKKYILLYGYRRYLAVKSLGRTTIAAQVYDESELSEHKRRFISITENGQRQDLNAADIADCLLAIKKQTGLNDEKIAEDYSESLSIGNSGKTINKYLQLANMKKSSPKIIEAVRNEKISFGAATDILATIGDAKERNLFSEKIAIPFELPRPSLQTVKNYLEKIGPGITKALGQKAVKAVISESLETRYPKKTLLAGLGSIAKDPVIAKQTVIAEAVSTLKKDVFGDDQLQDNLSVSSTSIDGDHKEITLQIKLTSENYADMLKKFEELAGEGKSIKDMFDKL